ncbi:MAG: TlpA family protein disulfide reductase [Gemmataceae bacterium]|nr:TlpA family protein disulfide reductase [Gemmataceae bacterium]
MLILSAFCVGGPFAPVRAQVTKEPPKKEKATATLKVGDRAPALKVTKWLQGDEVKTFEPGKVYVVEFWATWCSPCIAFMPHLAEIQSIYKDNNVTVIGFTSRDILGKGEHTESKVAEFVKKRGPKLKYTFVYSDDNVTADAWMKAADVEGIPRSFVVDKAGRIAYIGHPMYLPMVMPKVVAGTATAEAIGDEMAKVEAEFNTLARDLYSDPKAGLRTLKSLEAKYPLLVDFFMSVRIKLSCLPKYGEAGEAKEYAERLVARAIKRDDQLALTMVSNIFRSGDGKERKELLAIAVKAAEAEVRLAGGTDFQALINLASTYSVAGNAAKAKEYAGKAVEAAAGEPAATKEYVEKEARRLGFEK